MSRIKCPYSDLITNNIVFLLYYSQFQPVCLFYDAELKRNNCYKVWNQTWENNKWKGFPFLPEWFESEKTSPHHNEKVAAACSHCSHTSKAPRLLNIVPACVLSRVTTITFHRSTVVRRNVWGETSQRQQLSVRCCVWATSAGNSLFISISAAAGRFRSSRLCKGMHKGAKKRLAFNDCSHPSS